jgi:hypothetical protein
VSGIKVWFEVLKSGMKIVINTVFGGFDLNPEVQSLYKRYILEKDPDFVWPEKFFDDESIGLKLPRYDPCLVRAVEECGHENNNLKVVEIPEDIDWMIEEYDGFEWVSQKHTIFTEYPLVVPNGIPVGRGKTQKIFIPPTQSTEPSVAGRAIHECLTQ